MAKYDRNTLTGDLAPVNAELEKVQNAINDQLDRSVEQGVSNQMNNDIDMNSNQITNLAAPTSDNDAARKKDLDDLAASTGAFTGDLGPVGDILVRSKGTSGRELQGSSVSLNDDGDMLLNSVNGRDPATDGAKLDTVETGADQTNAVNVQAAGALMDSELTNEAAVKALDQGVSTTDAVHFLTVDGRDVQADGIVLDGLVTDVANNAAAITVIGSAVYIKTQYESNPNTNAFTDAEQSKLSGIASGATANSLDAFLLDRGNHTGTQTLSTISDAGTVAAFEGNQNLRTTDTATFAKITSIGNVDVGNYINFTTGTGTGLASERWMGADGANSTFYNVPSGSKHIFGVNNASALTIDANERVLVGASSGSNKLTVVDSVSSTVAGFTHTGSTDAYIGISGNSSSVFVGNKNGSFVVQTPGSGFSDKLTIDTIGNTTLNAPSVRQTNGISFDSIISGSDIIQKAVNAGTTWRIQDQTGQDRLAINLGSAAGIVTGNWTFNDKVGINVAPQSFASQAIYGLGTTNSTYSIAAYDSLGNIAFTVRDDRVVECPGNIGIGTVPVGNTRMSVAGSSADSVARFLDSTNSTFIQTGVGTQTYTTTWTGANSALFVGEDNTTNRSLNAGGTLNANGADYAEYVKKSADCGDVQKGDVIGFDINGNVTNKYSESVSFAVKSTSPSLVGGDTWGVTQRPEIITPDNIEYTGSELPTEPTVPEEIQEPEVVEEPLVVAKPNPDEFESAAEYNSELTEYNFYLKLVRKYQNYQLNVEKYNQYQLDLEIYNTALEQYNSDLTQYEADQSDYKTEVTAEQARVDTLNASNLANWESIHEAERQTVDRIAFCGVVPVNYYGSFNVGDFLIARSDSQDGITLTAKPDYESFADLKNCIGRVKEIEVDTGRPVIIVKVGG